MPSNSNSKSSVPDGSLLPSTHRVRAGLSLFSGLVMLCAACIDPYTTEFLSVDYGILVIDGYFVPNDTTRIRLSRTVTMDSPESIAPEPPAEVWVEGDNGFRSTLKTTDARLYTMPPMSVDYHAKYRLTVRTSDGREYASDYVPVAPRTTVDSVVVHEQPGSEEVTFSVFAHDPSNASWYYSYQYDETWEYSAANYSIYEYKNGVVVPRLSAAELFSCWKTRPSTDILLSTTAPLSADIVYDYPLVNMRQSDRRLYFGYSLNIRQYVITANAYSYWSIIKKNSEQLGTLFDPLPSQPDGNYSCTNDPGRNVVGFFTASDVSTRRMLVKREELQGPNELYQSDGYEACIGELLPLADVNETYMRTRLIHDARYDLISGQLIGYGVYPSYCLDCRMQGGVTKRPLFWR